MLDWPEPILLLDDSLLADAKGRVELAYGVVPAQEQGFAPDAFIARTPWRSAESQDLARLGVARGIGCRANTVALLTLPLACVDALRGGASAHGEACTQEWSSLVEAFLATTGRWRLEPSRARWQGYCRGPAATSGTTLEPKSGLRIGLHLDHWDALPLGRRDQAQNRICVNLGRGTRAFQVIPVPADALDAIAIQRGAATGGTDRSAVQRFLGASREQPVLRFLLRPGEAYIAPTERFLHDGCVIGTDEDVTFTCRGFIEPSIATAIGMRA